MSGEWLGVAGLLVMFVLMLLRTPVAIAMMVPAMAGILIQADWHVLSAAVHSTVWQHSLNYSLVTIPMFILMGEVLHVSGITHELYRTFQVWTGRMRGGLAVASIGASAGLAATSGSSIATTATMGTVSADEMINAGYDRRLAAGSIVAGGGLGILIPPSTILIIYATLTEQSIGELLIAAVIPGILMTLLFVLTIVVIVTVKPSMAPRGERYGWGERFRSLASLSWVIALFAVVVGGMYFGFFSPTEAASGGAFVAILIVAVRGSLSWEQLFTAIHRTVRTTGFVFAIVLAGFMMNYFLAISRLPITLSQTIADLQVPAAVLAVALLVLYVFLGCIMDSLAMLVVTMPVVFPIVESVGWSPIWFGIVMVIIIEMGLITPPVGMNCFVLHGVAPQLGMSRIWAGALYFVIPMIVLAVLLYIWPDIALFLPGRM